MAGKDYKAFIVEGVKSEPAVIDNISKVFFSKGNIKVITMPAGENIYMLWQKLADDDFDTDIIEVVRESNATNKKELEGLSRNDFAEVYLFFDYDVHHDNLGCEQNEDVIVQMLENFDNETENGKLYISYPMVEALRDYYPGICGVKGECYVDIDMMKRYKELSAEHSLKPQFDKYTIEDWKDIVDVFAMRVACLFGKERTLNYEQYSKEINVAEVYCKEKQIAAEKRKVFVLSAFPEFLVDYYGNKLWRTCVRHKKNKLKDGICEMR